MDRLQPVLRRVRALRSLRERTRGVFYLRGRAFFREDPEGLFADVRLGDAWTRMRASTRAEQARLLGSIARAATPPA